MPSKPKWTHDCENCRYLGSVSIRGAGPVLSFRFDLYTCEGNVGNSYLVRYGDGPTEYESIMFQDMGELMETPVAKLSMIESSLYLARVAHNRQRAGNRTGLPQE